LFLWDEYDFYFTLDAIFIAGLLIGFGQWAILNIRFKSAWAWIPSTAICLPVGSYVGFFGLAANMSSFGNFLDVVNFYIILAGVAGFAGLIIGVFQWLSLRTKFNGAFRWILVSVLSWGIGVALTIFIIHTYLPTNITSIYDGWLWWIIFGILMGVIVGAISGIFVKPFILNLSLPESNLKN